MGGGQAASAKGGESGAKPGRVVIKENTGRQFSIQIDDTPTKKVQLLPAGARQTDDFGRTARLLGVEKKRSRPRAVLVPGKKDAGTRRRSRSRERKSSRVERKKKQEDGQRSGKVDRKKIGSDDEEDRESPKIKKKEKAKEKKK